jgi:uncharacterized damage-inducible protein DinB
VEAEREVLALEPIAGDPEVGRWLSAMEDARRDTLRELEGVAGDAVDWRPDGAGRSGGAGGDANTIGSLLYHIALVEADWLLTDVLGPEAAPPWPADLLPFDDRDGAGRLTPVEGETLARHRERLEAVRSLFLEHMRSMSGQDFHRLRPRERFDVAADWVLHHLLQHEAEHRAQIAAIRDAHRSG